MNAIKTTLKRWWIVPAAGLALMGSSGTSRADNVRMPPTPLSSYQQECASCHTAYPPGLLPAESWQRIMSSLDRHYGADASLDAQTGAEISQWLRANAATYKRAKEAPADNRITRSAWFVREHREISRLSGNAPPCAARQTAVLAMPGRIKDGSVNMK